MTDVSLGSRNMGIAAVRLRAVLGITGCFNGGLLNLPNGWRSQPTTSFSTRAWPKASRDSRVAIVSQDRAADSTDGARR
jgi:hypothetical protein